MIAVIDYGMGNLRSVQKAFQFLGFDAVVTEDRAVLERADGIVLPGVGAFRDAVSELRKKGFDHAVCELVSAGRPLLGICLGMQLLFEKSYENGEYAGLGILPGEIVHLPGGVKAPHVGWNSLEVKKRAPLFSGLADTPYVYFVHSYYLETDADICAATCEYGKEFAVAAQRDNVFALQFHPEKSGDVGLKILKNFGGLCDADLSGN